jgi:hypothetical protein
MALKPNIPSLISFLFTPTKYATRLINITAENPVNPILGAKNVATIIIMANTLFSEKNI